MEFPNSREELQLNKDQLLELALRIMPMHCILQPGLPETAVAETGQRIFLYSHDRYLFYIHIYDLFFGFDQEDQREGMHG